MPKYLRNAEGRIFLANEHLEKLPGMTEINIHGFDDPVPETVDQLNAMLEKEKRPAKQAEIADEPEKFDYETANKKDIAAYAKEHFDAEIKIKNRSVEEVRKDFELLMAFGDDGDSGE